MFELLLILLLFSFCLFLLINGIKNFSQPPEKLKFNFKAFFINGYVNHNNVKIQKGECEIKFNSGKFFIIQDENIIEDNIFDIYNIRTWSYQGYYYVAINMKTNSEYIFSLLTKEDEESKLSKMIALCCLSVLQTLCKKLKIDFVECGETNNKDEDL